jgi:filamentous hemagglutinin family protein
MYRKWAKRRNAVLSVALLGMLALPNVGQAEETTTTAIMKSDYSIPLSEDSNHNVYNIMADKMLDDKTAFNHFKKFNLGPGNIANLFFHTSGGCAEAARLLNFVDEQMNIAGIVNAVQNNKIGGDLRFISPNGIAISATGVINAGQVGMVVPTEKYYNELVKIGDKPFQTGDNYAGILNAASLQNGEVPLNIDGSITVAGKINAVDGITLAASKINLNEGALLNSQQTINYADLVNVKNGNGTNGNESVSAGLDNDLQLTRNEAGDIVLAAVADTRNLSESSGVWSVVSDWLDQTGANVFNMLQNPTGATITMAKGAKINADSNVVIAAKTISSNVKPEDADENAVQDAINKTKPILRLQAAVDLSGEIKGETVNVAATLKDDYQFDKDTAKTIKSINVFNKLAFSGAYMIHDDAAKVNIQKNANITATGADIAADETSEKPTPALAILSSSEIRCSTGPCTACCSAP